MLRLGDGRMTDPHTFRAELGDTLCKRSSWLDRPLRQELSPLGDVISWACIILSTVVYAPGQSWGRVTII